MNTKQTAFGEISGILVGILEEVQSLYIKAQILHRQGNHYEAKQLEEQCTSAQDEFITRLEKQQNAA